MGYTVVCFFRSYYYYSLFFLFLGFAGFGVRIGREFAWF